MEVSDHSPMKICYYFSADIATEQLSRLRRMDFEYIFAFQEEK